MKDERTRFVPGDAVRLISTNEGDVLAYAEHPALFPRDSSATQKDYDKMFFVRKFRDELFLVIAGTTTLAARDGPQRFLTASLCLLPSFQKVLWVFDDCLARV